MRSATLVLVAALVFTVLAGCVAEKAPGDDATEQAETMAPRGRVVVALLEFEGTNPYHDDFRRDGQTEHPSTYLTGYPTDAVPLDLSLDLDDYASAEAADAPVWASYSKETLHYIPGTNIVGMITFGDATGLDHGGHGTGTSSLVGGTAHGHAPEADLVILNGDLFAAMRWVSEQEWIDVLSLSLGAFLGTCTVGVCDPVDICTGNPYLPVSLANSTRLIHLRGGETFGAAGYGCGFRAATVGHAWPGTSLTSFFSGPSWVRTIGTYDPRKEQAESDGAYPVDVLSRSWGYKAAAPSSIDGENWFGNASGAVPLSAGIYAEIVRNARETLGDTRVGHAGRILAEHDGVRPLPADGPLADGVFTQAEAEQVFLRTATVVDVFESRDRHGSDPDWADDLMPAPPEAEFLTQGYGMVNATTLDAALRVLDGSAMLPARPKEDAWFLATQTMRDAFWLPIDILGLYPI